MGLFQTTHSKGIGYLQWNLRISWALTVFYYGKTHHRGTIWFFTLGSVLHRLDLLDLCLIPSMDAPQAEPGRFRQAAVPTSNSQLGVI